MSQTFYGRLLSFINMSLLVLLISSPVEAARYVAVSGTDSGDCQDPLSPCATISYALSQATNNDSIRLGIGSFSVLNETLDLDLTIEGEGITSTTIDANKADRTFTISGGATVYINDVKIKDGLSGTDGGGLLIQGDSTLYLENCHLINNESGNHGGALHSDGGNSISIDNCIIENNVSKSSGGGVSAVGGVTKGIITIYQSRIYDNKSNQASGGGLYLVETDLDLSQSLVDDNNTYTDGGGLYFESTGPEARIVNATFSGNQANRHGGGIHDEDGDIYLDFVTISNNTADADSVGGSGDNQGDGGGLYNFAGIVDVKNTIIAGNIDPTSAPDCSGGGSTNSKGTNLIGTNEGCSTSYSSDPSDQIGTAASPIDAKLNPLDDNGGATETHSLQSDSPAVDKGTCQDQGGSDIYEDQRNSERPIGSTCDIGAYELSVCGDDIWSVDEECEDGNTIDTDDCTSECKDNICGDGFVLADWEECDDGNTQDGDGCDSDCLKEAGLGGCSLIRRK